MNSNALVVGLCALSLGATSYLVVSRPKDDGDRVAELEARLAAAEKRADAVDALSAQLRDIEGKLDRRTETASRRSETAPVSLAAGTMPTAMPSAPGAADESGAPAKGLDELVADRVEKRMAEKLDSIAARDRERGDDGKWKAPIEALAKELALTEAQKAEAKRVFDRAKDDGYVLLKTQRLDGGSMLDDLVAELKGGADPQASIRKVFGRILTEKVPGSDQTYLAEFVAMSQDVEAQLSRQLDAGQVKRLKALNVSLLEVQTGYDPSGDYVRARLQ